MQAIFSSASQGNDLCFSWTPASRAVIGRFECPNIFCVPTFSAGRAPVDLNTSTLASLDKPSPIVTRRPNQYVEPSPKLALGSVTTKSFSAPAWRSSRSYTHASVCEKKGSHGAGTKAQRMLLSAVRGQTVALTPRWAPRGKISVGQLARHRAVDGTAMSTDHTAQDTFER